MEDIKQFFHYQETQNCRPRKENCVFSSELTSTPFLQKFRYINISAVTLICIHTGNVNSFVFPLGICKTSRWITD